MTLLNEKNDCVDSIRTICRSTSLWRKCLTVRWPDDPRNARASTLLDQLVGDVAKLSDEQWSALKHPYHWASEGWRDSLNQTARQVGFHHRNGDLDCFIKALLQNLSVSKSVAA
jgi:hypothetical protein